jgi:hypothetical protein
VDLVGRLQLGPERSDGAVDEHVAEEVEQFPGAILRPSEREQAGVLVDEVSVHCSFLELAVVQHVQQERYVRLREIITHRKTKHKKRVLRISLNYMDMIDNEDAKQGTDYGRDN